MGVCGRGVAGAISQACGLEFRNEVRRIGEKGRYKEEEVYIWWYLYYTDLVAKLLPLKLSMYLIKHLFAKGMKSFVGRKQNQDDDKQKQN